MDAHAPADAKLTAMANQIAAYFHAYPDDEARAGVAKHIADFWTPAMRCALQSRIDSGAPGLDPLVTRALGCGGA